MTAISSPTGKSVLCIYSIKDQYFCNELGKYLAQLVNDRIIDRWDRKYLLPGADWKASNTDNVRDADIIIFLVSPDFLCLDYCFDTEVRMAVERHIHSISRVIPIIVRPVEWHEAPFGWLAPLPTDGSPLTEWPSLDDAWFHINTEVRKVIDATSVERYPGTATILSTLAEQQTINRVRLEIALDASPDGMTTIIASQILADIRKFTNDNSSFIHRVCPESNRIILCTSSKVAQKLIFSFNDETIDLELRSRVLSLAIRGNEEVKTDLVDRFVNQNYLVLDPQMKRIYAQMRKHASRDYPIMITGETGVGKEVLAQTVHSWSGRTGRLVSINAATIPKPLFESELFGHKRGSFTSARERSGLIQHANGGTLFLDEITELSLSSQAKLLRVLEEKRIRAVGADEDKAVDFRLIACTNKDIEQEVHAGRFRRDLFYRICSVPVQIPPLRVRRREIIPFANLFLDDYCNRYERPLMSIPQYTSEFLLMYGWPGNIREMKSTMQIAALSGASNQLEPWDLPERMLIP